MPSVGQPDCVGSIGIRTVVSWHQCDPDNVCCWLDDCPASLQQLWNKVVMTEREEPRLLKLK
jgi:hypothetical protein